MKPSRAGISSARMDSWKWGLLPALGGVCAAVTALLVTAGAAVAGAWVQPRDGYYFKLSTAWLDSGHEFNSDGEKVDILAGDPFVTDASYRDLTVGAYVEYGLTDRLTILGTLPFRVLSSRRTQSIASSSLSRDIDATTAGFGDLSLGARYPLHTGTIPVSVQGSVRVPLGYDRAPENGGPPLGSGRLDAEGRLLAGLSLYPFPGYLTGGVGYRFRGGDIDDELLFEAEAGATWGRISGRIGVSGVYSTGDPPELADEATSSVVITDQDILQLIPALGVRINDEISLVVEAFHIVDGRNTVAGTTWSAGVVFQQ